MKLFPDALVNAVLGYGVVFTGLILLLAVVVIMGKVMTAKKSKVVIVSGNDGPTALLFSDKQDAPAKDGPVAPGSAGQIALHDVPDKEAAMLMAIVADKLGKPVNELRFKSIKEVK